MRGRATEHLRARILLRDASAGRFNLEALADGCLGIALSNPRARDRVVLRYIAHPDRHETRVLTVFESGFAEEVSEDSSDREGVRRSVDRTERDLPAATLVELRERLFEHQACQFSRPPDDSSGDRLVLELLFDGAHCEVETSEETQAMVHAVRAYIGSYRGYRMSAHALTTLPR
jgi:hypothetical protein